MRHSLVFFFLVYLLAAFCFPAFAAKREALWQEVQKAKDDGLPQTAIDKLKPIIEGALAEGKLGEAAKAICERIVLEGNIQGNKPEEKILRLEKEIGSFDPKLKPLMQSVLARWYWHYFQQNKWRFLNRSQTVGLDEKDFTTWDLPKLFAKIGSIHEEILKAEEDLKKYPIGDFLDFLQKGTQPDELRPTLYDFLAHEALTFYTSGEQAAARPQEAFDIPADSPALQDSDKFLSWNPETNDRDSPKYKALVLYQKLVSFHSRKGNTDAQLDVDLLRLGWARNVVVGETAGENYIREMKMIASRYQDNPFSSLALAHAAQELFQQGKRKEAHEIALEGNKRFPTSRGGIDCRVILSQITAKALSVNSERVAGKPAAQIQIQYANIDKVYFKLVARNWKKLLDKENYNPSYPNWRDFEWAEQAQPETQWEVPLDPTPDFQPVTKIVDFPKVEPGFYFLVASYRKDFSRSSNAIRIAPVWVSSLALVTRVHNSKVEGFVLENETGEPVPGAQVTAYIHDYNSGWSVRGREKTDANGFFSLSGGDREILPVVEAKGEVLMDPQMLYAYGENPPQTNEMVFFFTDRGLYRPGQEIRFKGIAVRVSHNSDTYDVITDREILVTFRDVNGQEIANQKLTTNDFGSFSGQFTAPVGRLTGHMTINAMGPHGSTGVQVEEYKRPKFKVSLEVPTEGAKLGEEALIKGDAMAYTGAAIDGAKVKYRVTREVSFPEWCWWWRIPVGSNQEITHGTTETDRNGKFKISFIARPDQKYPEKDQPVFTFRITADVTDSSGETRSQTQMIRVGFTAMELGVSIPSWIQSNSPFSAAIRTHTLDGKGVPAGGSILIHSLKAPEAPIRPSLFGIENDPSEPRAWESGPVAAEETFNTSIDGTTDSKFTLKPGVYRMVATSRDRFNKPVKFQQEFIVVDPATTDFPVKIPFHFQVQSPVVEVGETFRALWGTGYEKGRAFVEIEHRRKILKSFWTNPGDSQFLLELPVKEEMRGGFSVRIYQVRENRTYIRDFPVQVPWSNKNLQISFDHFTSKLQPGQKDTWTLSIKGPEAQAKAIEFAATLYDASLDAFLPFSWMTGFGFFRRDDSQAPAHGSNHLLALNNTFEDWNSYESSPYYSYTAFPGDIVTNFIGYEFADQECMPCSAPSGGAPMPSRSMADSGPVSRSIRSEKMKELKSTSDEAPEMEASVAAPNSPKDGRGGGASSTPAPTPDLSKVSARVNLNETAFFFPHLITEEDGSVKLEFTIPEALTTWKFLGFAHGRHSQSGGITKETVTQKDLMVQPNPPRFLREGDQIAFTAKVTNLSDEVQKGKIRLSLLDPATDSSRDAEFKVTAPDQEFEIPAKESRSFAWVLEVPDGPGILKYKVVGATGKLSDGEEGLLPVLARRIFVTESLPLPIRGPATKEFKLQKLIDSKKSDTLVTEALTVQVTSNPAWYAVQALPYLMEFPHECSEQTFNRLYANSLARFIATSDPKIRKVFDTWKADEAQGGKALLSNLEKNEQLKSVVLLETPWVRQAKSETQAKHNVGVLFDANRLENELDSAMNKLSKMQLNDGSWPWFPGGRGDTYITLYIMTGFGRLRHLGVDIKVDQAVRALSHLDAWVDKEYREILKYGHKDENHLSHTIAFFLYGRSFFLKDRPIPPSSKEAVNYFLGQGKKYWLQLDCRLGQGHLALGLSRFGDSETANKIFASMKERSVTDEELGRFWRDTELSWWWYRAPIETQAIMIELFDEIGKDPEGVEDCKVWLLKQKQTQDWKTTKATADAIYALLLKGANLLASDKLVRVSLGGAEVKPEKVEAGTGFYEKRFAGPEVAPSMGEVSMTKEDKGVAWGGLHWQYFEDMSKVTPHETNLKLKKTLFKKEDSPKGPVIKPVAGKLTVGDLLVVRIELRTDRDMEYVHMKDQRGAGLEPTEVISQYQYQDGLAYYQSTKDTASHFYIDYLPKGTYVFEYTLRIQHKGKYQTGMAEIQCMYAPEFGSHSQSFVLEVE